MRREKVITVDEALDDLVHSTVEHIPAVDHAAITVVSRRDHGVSTPAASSAYPRQLNHRADDRRQNPCVDAALGQQVYKLIDLATDSRWSHFRADVVRYSPIESIVAYPLFSNDNAAGSFSLYLNSADALDHETRELGSVFATHAAAVWASLHRSKPPGDEPREDGSSEGGRDPDASRIIGLATGMIMHRDDFNVSSAIAYLHMLAQFRGVVAADAARTIVDEHNSRVG